MPYNADINKITYIAKIDYDSKEELENFRQAFGENFGDNDVTPLSKIDRDEEAYKKYEHFIGFQNGNLIVGQRIFVKSGRMPAGYHHYTYSPRGHKIEEDPSGDFYSAEGERTFYESPESFATNINYEARSSQLASAFMAIGIKAAKDKAQDLISGAYNIFF